MGESHQGCTYASIVWNMCGPARGVHFVWTSGSLNILLRIVSGRVRLWREHGKKSGSRSEELWSGWEAEGLGFNLCVVPLCTQCPILESWSDRKGNRGNRSWYSDWRYRRKHLSIYTNYVFHLEQVQCHAQSLFPKKMLESSLWAHIPITINIERSLKALTWPDHLLILRPKGHLTRVGPMAHQSRTWCSSRPLPRPSVQFPLMHFNFLWHVTNHKTIVATCDAMQVTKHVTVTHDTSNKNDSTTAELPGRSSASLWKLKRLCNCCGKLCSDSEHLVICAAMLSCAKSRYKCYAKLCLPTHTYNFR